jgi:hypothetical protein
VQGLQQLGWTDGRNVRIDARWSVGESERMRKNAAEVVGLTPDVIVAEGSAGLAEKRGAERRGAKLGAEK